MRGSVNAVLTPYALSATLYPSRGPPMTADLVRDYVAEPWTSGPTRLWPTSRQTDFIIHGNVSSYQQPGRAVVPDLVPYLRMPLHAGKVKPYG